MTRSNVGIGFNEVIELNCGFNKFNKMTSAIQNISASADTEALVNEWLRGVPSNFITRECSVSASLVCCARGVDTKHIGSEIQQKIPPSLFILGNWEFLMKDTQHFRDDRRIFIWSDGC